MDGTHARIVDLAESAMQHNSQQSNVQALSALQPSKRRRLLVKLQLPTAMASPASSINLQLMQLQASDAPLSGGGQ